MPTKPIFQIVYIGELRSSFLRPPHYKSMGKKENNFVILTLAQAYLSGIMSYRIVVDHSTKNLHCLPLERSFEVTEVTNRHLSINFDQKELDTWDWCQYVCLG